MNASSSSSENSPLRHRASHVRLWIAGALGAILLLILPYSWPMELRTLLAWNVAVAGYLILGWHIILSSDANDTRDLSRLEDEHRGVIDTILILASFISLVGVLKALAKAEQLKETFGLSLTCVAIAAVVLSWFLVHTLYAFHYARLYYEGEGAGDGVDFHGDEPPDYLDFCYLSFAVGTTFGATDSEIGGRPIRRTIFKHSLLSFTFATVIVSLALSIVSDLISS